jgi:glutaredoxin-like YruB-family protein
MSTGITIYSTPTCGFCHMLKSYLKSQDITYTEKDITVDREAYDIVEKTTGQLAVPVMTLGDEFVIGFDKPRIDQLLKQNHLLKAS